MKVTPIAYNHIHIELDNGEILDVNDGTKAPKGGIRIQLIKPTDFRMVVSTPVTYDGTVTLEMEKV